MTAKYVAGALGFIAVVVGNAPTGFGQSLVNSVPRSRAERVADLESRIDALVGANESLTPLLEQIVARLEAVETDARRRGEGSSAAELARIAAKIEQLDRAFESHRTSLGHATSGTAPRLLQQLSAIERRLARLESAGAARSHSTASERYYWGTPEAAAANRYIWPRPIER